MLEKGRERGREIKTRLGRGGEVRVVVERWREYTVRKGRRESEIIWGGKEKD